MSNRSEFILSYSCQFFFQGLRIWLEDSSYGSVNLKEFFDIFHQSFVRDNHVILLVHVIAHLLRNLPGKKKVGKRPQVALIQPSYPDQNIFVSLQVIRVIFGQIKLFVDGGCGLIQYQHWLVFRIIGIWCQIEAEKSSFSQIVGQ